MATEFDDTQHWGLFLTRTAFTGESGKYVRVSELVLAALRAAGVLDNMIDGSDPPATDKLWLDKNHDPAILKEWDASGSSWVPMTFDRLFGRAAVDKLTVTGGTGNALVASATATFKAARLYLITPTADNSGPATIQVSGIGTYPVKYGDGSDIGITEFTAGRPSVLFFTGARFEVLFPIAILSASLDAAEAAAEAASIQASLAASYAASAGQSLGLLSFPTLAVLLSDNKLSYIAGPGLTQVQAGQNVVVQGFRYVIAASGVTNHQVATAGGVKLYQGEPSAGGVSANYDVLLTDQGRMLVVNASASPRIVRLPASATVGNGFRVIIQKADASANAVTVDAYGTETIDGQLNYILLFGGQSVALICDGTGWRVMGSTETFETGVTPTGEYVKRADGWMTCTYRNDYTNVPTNSAAGSLFMSPGISPGNFPQPFVSPPVVHHSGIPGGANGFTMCAVASTATNWGTYRTASYVSDESRNGKLMLVAEGRWGGAAGGSGTLILKAGATEDSLIVGRRGASTITRGFNWNAVPAFQMADNQYPVFSLTSDSVNGLPFRIMNDDVAPYLVNGSHLGGIHSLFGCRLNTGAHGKTQADIGSVWANGGVQFVLLRIMSPNQLFVARLDSDVDAPTGTYTHVSGAVNTTSFPCGASVREPFYPMISGRTINIQVDGQPISASSGIWSYSDTVVFSEAYDVLSRSEVLNWFRTNGAGGTLDVTGSPLFSVAIQYRFDAEGNLTISQSFTAKQSITVNRLYGLQMQLAASTAFYIPKTTPFTQDGNTLDYANIETRVTNATDVILDTTKTLAGGLYLDRIIAFNGNNGLATGLLPVQIAEPVARRSTYTPAGNTGMSIVASGKTYLSAVSRGNHTLTAGQSYSFTGYRNPVIRDANRTALYPVRSAQGDFLYADWHNRAATDLLPVPASFVGRSFTVFEKSSNVAVSSGVLGETLSVTVSASGGYGYLVLKLD